MWDTPPVHGIPFPIVHAEWSIVLRSFRIMLFRMVKDCFKLTYNNNNMNTNYHYHNENEAQN